MKKNVGGIDRILRGVAGVAILAWGLATGQPWWVDVIGGIVLLTALISFCPAYLPLGLSTAKKD